MCDISLQLEMVTWDDFWILVELTWNDPIYCLIHKF